MPCPGIHISCESRYCGVGPSWGIDSSCGALALLNSSDRLSRTHGILYLAHHTLPSPQRSALQQSTPTMKLDNHLTSQTVDALYLQLPYQASAMGFAISCIHRTIEILRCGTSPSLNLQIVDSESTNAKSSLHKSDCLILVLACFCQYKQIFEATEQKSADAATQNG